MSVELLTKEDLRQFKAELLTEIRLLLAGQIPQQGRMLKSYQVRELLGISPGTLHKLRKKGILPYVEIDGMMLYPEADMMALIHSHGKGRK